MPAQRELPHRNQWLGLAIPILIGCYLVGTSTVTFYPDLSPWDVKRIGEIVLFAMVLPTALFIPAIRHASIRNLSEVPRFYGLGLSLMLVLGLASAIANSETTRAFLYSLLDVSVFALLFSLLIVVAACRDLSLEHFDRLVASAFVLLGLGVGIQELAGFWASRTAGYSYSFDIALLHFSHPRMYNHLQTWTVPIIAAVPYLFLRNRLALVLSVLALGLHWYVLLVTGARGSVISLILAISVLAILSRAFRRHLVRIQLAGVLLGASLFFFSLALTGMTGDEAQNERGLPVQETNPASIIEAPPEPEPNPKLAPSGDLYALSIGRPMLHTTGRSGMWKSALGYVASNPLLGIGPMNFACKGPVGRVGSPHNLAFQILSEWGIPAAAILGVLALVLLVTLLKSLVSAADPDGYKTVLRAALICAVLAAAIHLMVSSLLIAPASQVAAALVGGWLFALRRRGDKREPMRFSVGWLTLTATCSLTLLAFAQHEMSNMASYRDQLPRIEQGRPRFWQLGKACSPRIKLQEAGHWLGKE